ncbi:hypothetical protein GPU06_04425 [Streptococcus thermophilus]|nr:hypothetical protein [Streptococcus thermophilus]MCE2083908.1 hypothetical protein [Streptococcus thermophilus]
MMINTSNNEIKHGTVNTILQEIFENLNPTKSNCSEKQDKKQQGNIIKDEVDEFQIPQIYISEVKAAIFLYEPLPCTLKRILQK